MAKRLDRDDYFMRMAHVVSLRGTCPRRWIGTVLVDRHGHVLATGYNGVAAGRPHCIETPCPGANQPKGQGSACEAIHAEQNALLQLADMHAVETVYTTESPCPVCMKLLLNTSAERIVCFDLYPHGDAPRLWREAGRSICQVDPARVLHEAELAERP